MQGCGGQILVFAHPRALVPHVLIRCSSGILFVTNSWEISLEQFISFVGVLIGQFIMDRVGEFSRVLYTNSSENNYVQIKTPGFLLFIP